MVVTSMLCPSLNQYSITVISWHDIHTSLQFRVSVSVLYSICRVRFYFSVASHAARLWRYLKCACFPSYSRRLIHAFSASIPGLELSVGWPLIKKYSLLIISSKMSDLVKYKIKPKISCKIHFGMLHDFIFSFPLATCMRPKVLVIISCVI